MRAKYNELEAISHISFLARWNIYKTMNVITAGRINVSFEVKAEYSFLFYITFKTHDRSLH